MAANTIAPNTLITTKLLYNGSIRRFKIQLKDCGANTLPGKLKELLAVPENDEVIFERWSDSAASYVILDSNKPAVYKQLYRAAKAKLKLRIKVTHPVPEAPVPEPFHSNTSAETLLPPYASTSNLTSPPATVTESTMIASVPLEKVSEAVVAYLEGEEGRSKLRSTIGEEVEKEIEKRTLAQSLANLASPAPAEPLQKTREVNIKQILAVYCNVCSSDVDNTHYHCDICDGGDFDLCEKCVAEGKHCEKSEHWMIKRTIVNGAVIASREVITSDTAFAAKKAEDQPKKEEPKAEDEEPQDVLGRTCNSCCEDFDDNQFVECATCPDYDLCLQCHIKQNHGHDPSHGFKPATEDTLLSPFARTLLKPGKNFRHFAICDGCDKQIYGIRHKCFTCPDWDYCSDCYKSAKEIHPGHRFAAIYEALDGPVSVCSQPQHYGVYCDGPHCSSKGYCSWITGVRYKCAICPDFDLCAGCEASPANTHNQTHPMIKLKTPIRHVTVQTLDSETSVQLGDKVPSTTSSVVSNASTSVQTVGEAQPKEEDVPASSAETAEVVSETVEATAEKVEEKIDEKVSEVVEQEPSEELERYISVYGEVLIKASLAKQQIPDGAVLKAHDTFTQTWTLVNNGPVSWPVGTTMKFIAGDNICGTALTTTDSKVETGTSVDFSVLFVAPAGARRYNSYWGLVASDGVRFGPQLWCDFVVQPEEVKPVELQAKEEGKEEVTEEVKEEIKEGEANFEDVLVDLMKSHTSEMIFPTLEKESPSSSVVNVAEASVEAAHEEVLSSAASFTTVADEETAADLGDDDVISEVYSVAELDDELENFISDDEDYEVWDASDDEEFGSSTNGSAGSRA